MHQNNISRGSKQLINRAQEINTRRRKAIFILREMMITRIFRSALLLAVMQANNGNIFVSAFGVESPSTAARHQTSKTIHSSSRFSRCSLLDDNAAGIAADLEPTKGNSNHSRRGLLGSMLATAGGWMSSSLLKPNAALAEDATGGVSDDESFAAIAARASKLNKDLDKELSAAPSTTRQSDKSAYDFSLPVQGVDTKFADLIQQKSTDEDASKVKAILVVNMKQDDPVARKAIPELMALASKYRSTGALAVVLSPSDQGYYEPDTSVLIRLKLASEYGYGLNPATVLTDKVIFLGTGAHPFWRWLQSTCRTPAGLGRIEANFEKFLIDGRTGQPLRRYPRKYDVTNMYSDVDAVVEGRTLPPARAGWLEEWRGAAVDAKTNTYRFEKGLNYFDQ